MAESARVALKNVNQLLSEVPIESLDGRQFARLILALDNMRTFLVECPEFPEYWPKYWALVGRARKNVHATAFRVFLDYLVEE